MKKYNKIINIFVSQHIANFSLKQIHRISFCCIILFTQACASYHFTQTGKLYCTLPDEALVRVFDSEPEQEYEIIGTVAISEGDRENAIKTAIYVSRQKGGDGIIPNNARIHEFKIIKLIEKEKLAVDFKDDTEETDAVQEETVYQPAYKKASFNQLLNDYDSIKGEKYQGRLFPRKLLKKVPWSLKKFVKKRHKLVMLSTANGKRKILLIIPPEKVRWFKEKIKSNEEIDFIYTPITSYKTRKMRSPVIEFVSLAS